jgi:alpha-mannosidase
MPVPEEVGTLRHFVRELVRPAIYPRQHPLDVAAHHLRGEPISAEVALTQEFSSIAVGHPWGGMWGTTWFRFRGPIPADWAGAEVVALVHLGGDEMVGFTAEGQVWDSEAQPIQGLHHMHREYPLIREAGGGERVEFFVEAAANPIPPWRLSDWPLLMPDYAGAPLYDLGQAELAIADRQVEGLYLDLRVLLGLAKLVPVRRDDAIAALWAARRAIDPADVAGSVAAARAVIAPFLAEHSSSTHTVTAVGHAHIDTAWLWPIRETKRKCARTFSNQLRLLEHYPEHHFVCSQAVQYQWMKDEYPILYEQICHWVRRGRWEPVGGMWVEADTNVPSGESLVRQIIHGKRFFSDEFGIETHELWIPDVFGYSAALPQIAVQAGVTALITQKMSWNDTNAFPHSTFWWEGHDGSRILAHFPPVDTYNGEFSISELLKSQNNHKDRDRSDCSLYPFGFGDGGGGPTRHMVENARRLADVDGLPKVQIGSVATFLDQLRIGARGLATWVGELYLEAHRATLTTHADVKRANRRGEEALRAAEIWTVAAGLDHRELLDHAWKLLLVQQFHDIIPGSGIHWVYLDAGADHAEVLNLTEPIIAEAQAQLAGVTEGDELVAFNSSSYDRTEVIDLPDGSLGVVSVPGCGWSAINQGGHAAEFPSVEIGEGFLDNGYLHVEWDEDGLLSSVRDQELAREVLAEGRRGNLFQLHEDHPQAFDAWDVDRTYLDHVADLVSVDSIEIVERDPLRAGVRIVRRFGESEIRQTMRLAAGSRRLEFHTEVDWHERHRFLKVAFPVAVRSTRATYEIQHGHIERPTVTNTSWDEARFEVCGHRWADLSEPGYGVALLNNCKYGYDIRGCVMRLSLLRGPGFPDPAADQGAHRFSYALLPHPDDFQRGGQVVAEAEFFNLPLTIVGGRNNGRVVTVHRPGVSIEAVKWADNSNDIVVRLCEVWGSRAPVRVTLHLPFSSAITTDLLERELTPLKQDGSSVTLQLRPFELVTLKFATSRRQKAPR